jgi:hypothetical protein
LHLECVNFLSCGPRIVLLSFVHQFFQLDSFSLLLRLIVRT